MGWLRYPKTTQERRNDEWARAKRNFRNLPNAYDDIIRTVQRSWKKHRSTQYHTVDMSEEPHERKRRRCRTRPLDSVLMEDRHATAEQTPRQQVGTSALLPQAEDNPGKTAGPGWLGQGEEELSQLAEPLGRLPQTPRPVLEELPQDQVQGKMTAEHEKQLVEFVTAAYKDLINMGIFMKMGSQTALETLARKAYELGVSEGRRPRSIQESLEECKKWRMTDEEEAELLK